MESEIMEQIKEFFQNKDLFARHCGIKLLEVSKGSAKAQVEIKKHTLNGLGTSHGGIIFTLADLAFAAAANSHGTVAVAINVSISYLKAVSEGFLTAEAKELSCNRKISSYTVDVTDQSGDTVAVFQGMAYRKNIKIPLPNA